MSDENQKKLSPAEGHSVVMDLVGDLVQSSVKGDTEGLDGVLRGLGAVVQATGIDVPGIQDDLAALSGEVGKIQLYNDNFAAAMWAGDLERANALTEAGIPVNYDNIPGVNAPMEDDFTNDDAYTEDLAEDDPQMIELLAEFAQSQPDPILPDLYADIAKGKKGAISTFIASGEDPNVPCGEELHTALLAALDAPNRRAEKVTRLIEAGADARVVHPHGDNALSWAMGYNHPNTVTPASETQLMEVLVQYGAAADHMTDLCGWTPLHRAIVQGDVARVTGALAAGCDVSEPTSLSYEPEKLAGFTPLMLAAPKPAVLQLLLDKGANPLGKDGHDRLPLDVISQEAEAARIRIDDTDPWTRSHAEALTKSCNMLYAATSA